MTTHPNETWLREQVRGLATTNRQTGHAPWCGLDYDFLCPSEGTYPFQWFWDSCFHAIALSHVDLPQAKAEIRSLLANQHDDGFVSHVTFWQRERYLSEIANYAVAFRSPYLTDEMQPPLLAEAVASIVNAGADDAFLADVLPGAVRYYDWLDKVRAPFADGLIRVLHPDETGLDHSPKFDELLGITTEEHRDFTAAWYRVADHYETFSRNPERMFVADRFVVADVMVNTIYVHNLRVLADLLEGTDHAARAASFRNRANVAVTGLLELCWHEDDGVFYDLAGADRHHLRTNTITSLFPLLLPDISPDMAERLISQVTDPAKYWAENPLPSVAMDEPSFQPGTVGGNLVWRGPTWLNSNWYVARGLKRAGREDLARQIADRSADLIRGAGFREYYDPHTGEGHGAHHFGWSAIALDLVIEAYR